MFIRNIFLAKPLVAFAVLMCMATMIALFKLNRRKPQSKVDQFLIGFLGVLTIYEALRLIKNSSGLSLAMNTAIDDAIELLVAAACLTAAILLRFSRKNHLDIESAIRLARAAPPRSTHLDVPIGAKEPATLEALNWALPRVSDGAFRLLALLCLRTEARNGRVPLGATDVQIKLGRSREDMEKHLKELQDAGAIDVKRSGDTINLEITGPFQRAASPPEPLVSDERLISEAQT